MSPPTAVASPATADLDPISILLPAVRSHPRPGALAASAIFGWRALLKIRHDPKQLVESAAIPILFTVLFTYLFGGAIGGSPGHYLTMLLPGTLTMSIAIVTMCRSIGGQHPGLGAVACSIAPSRQDTQITMNRLTLGGLACGLALLLPACSSGLPDNGPLGNSGQNSGTICDWATLGGVVQDGFEEFNDTGGMATIDKVALVRPRHLQLIAAWVGEGNTPIGKVDRGYPHPTKAWKRVPGAVVHPNHGQESINLVIVVKPTAKLGTATAINMYYHVGGTHYLRQFTDGLKIPVGHKCN